MNPARAGSAEIQWAALDTSSPRTKSWNELEELLPRDRVLSPELGLPAALVEPLVEVLCPNEGDLGRVCFMAWEGYAATYADLRSSPRAYVPCLNEALLVMVSDGGYGPPLVEDVPFSTIAPWWLAGDGSWCVAAERYGKSVFVACEFDLVSKLPENEVYEMSPLDNLPLEE